MGSVNTILQANNATRVARSEYRANVARAKNTNTLEVAKINLGEGLRTLSNQMRMDAAGKEYNAAVEDLNIELENSATRNTNQQLQLAQAQGALAAQAGALGVGGSSVDLMDTMVRLQGELEQETSQRGIELLASRGQKRAAQVIVNAGNSQDLSRTFGSFDYSQYIEPKAMKRRLGKLIGVAVATYFGGPMAGEAVADFAVGTWKADNADFVGAGQATGNAARNGLGAAKDWSERGGDSWWNSTFGGSTSSDQGSLMSFGNNQDNFNVKGGADSSGLGWGW